MLIKKNNKKQKNKTYKKVKRKNTIKNLFNVDFKENTLKISDKELVIVFEVEPFNIDIMTKKNQESYQEMFKVFYDIINRPSEIHIVEVAKNFDNILEKLEEKIENATNEPSREIFKSAKKYLNESETDIVGIKYYLKFSVKSQEDYNHITSSISTAFKNNCKIKQLNAKELKILLNQTINFDYYDDFKMGLSSNINSILGGDEVV